MYSRGHEGVSLLLYAPIALALMMYSPEYTALAVYGALIVWELRSFPDKDMKWKNHSIPVIRRGGRFGITLTTRPLVKHRGATHTIWFALFVIAPITGVIGAIFVETAAYLGTIVFYDPLLFMGFVAVTVLVGELAEYAGGIVQTRALPVLALLSILGIIQLPALYDPQLFIAFSAFAGFFGIMAHLMGDMLTPTGVRLLDAPWPFNKIIPFSDVRLTVNVTKAANMRWNYGLWVVGYVVLVSTFIVGNPTLRTSVRATLGI